MNYKLVNYTAHIDAPQKLFCDVLEATTGHIIESGLPRREAMDMCRTLNFGGGFNGWTPAFFLQKTNFSYSENEDLL